MLKRKILKQFPIYLKLKIRIYQQLKTIKIIELLFFIWIYSTIRKNQEMTNYISVKKLIFE